VAQQEVAGLTPSGDTAALQLGMLFTPLCLCQQAV